MTAARWVATVAAGVLLWLLALAVLDVPGNLPQWRHWVGAGLMLGAMHLWRRE